MEGDPFAFENNKRAANICRNFDVLLARIEDGEANLAEEKLWSQVGGVEITDPRLAYIKELEKFVNLMETPEVTEFLKTQDSAIQKRLSDDIIRARIYLQAFNN